MRPDRAIAALALATLILGACSSTPAPDDETLPSPSAVPPGAGWVTDLDPAPFFDFVSAGRTSPARLNEAAGRTVGTGVWVAEVDAGGLCVTNGTRSLTTTWGTDLVIGVADGCVEPQDAPFAVGLDLTRVEDPPEVLAGDPEAPETRALLAMAERRREAARAAEADAQVMSDLLRTATAYQEVFEATGTYPEDPAALDGRVPLSGGVVVEVAVVAASQPGGLCVRASAAGGTGARDDDWLFYDSAADVASEEATGSCAGVVSGDFEAVG